MEPVVVFEFETHVPIVMPSNLKRKVLHAVNMHNIGREIVPLNEKWPEGKHGPMQDVHWRLATTHMRKLTIQVMSDGNLVIKK